MKICLTILWTWTCAVALVIYGVDVESSCPDDTVVVTPAYISRLSEELLEKHPALRAARARTEAAEAGVTGVRTWEDPMLRLGGMFANEMMRADEGDLMYGVEQKLPLFGRPRLSRQAAEAELSTEQADAEYRFQLLRRDFAQALFRTALANHIVAIGREDLDWLARMVQITEQRYRTGDSTLVDLLRLQNEEQKRADQIQTDLQLLAHEQLILNRLLNRDLQAPWPALDLPAIADPVPYNRQLVEVALRFEPGLNVRRREIEQAESMARLIRRERYPDVTLGAQARNYSGTGDFRQAEIMLGLSIPWGNTRRYRSDYDRARARARAAEQESVDYSLDLQEEIHLLTVRIDAARREALLYRNEIVPRSERALESAQAAWTVNRGLFLDVLDARRMLLEARLMQARAVTRQYSELYELVLACGLDDFSTLIMTGADGAFSTDSSLHEE